MGISRAFPGMWKAVNLRGLLVHGRLQGPQPQTLQPHAGSKFIFHTSDAGAEQLTQRITFCRRLVKAIRKSKS